MTTARCSFADGCGALISRVDTCLIRSESLEANDEWVRGEYLDARRGALVRAQGQTSALLNLFDVSKNLRLTMRGLNSFLNAIMEKRISCGEEAFSDFMISLVRGYSRIDAKHLEALELYIALSYGASQDPDDSIARRDG